MDVQTFENLDVFQRSYRISLDIHKISLGFPKFEQFGLADQMRRASKGIPAVIAEGYGKRSSKAEFKRYLRIAIGSADELRVWIRYCRDLEYISENEWVIWSRGYREIAKMLNSLCKRL